MCRRLASFAFVLVASLAAAVISLPVGEIHQHHGRLRQHHSLHTNQSSAASGPVLAFRLDDYQCWWKTTEAEIVMDTFIANNLPLTVGVITGPGQDCFASSIAARYKARPDLIEVASHSVAHVDMTTLTYGEQLQELTDSKLAIEQNIPTKVNLFIPPENVFNLDTVAAMAVAGYTKMSAQCTVVQTDMHTPPNMCVTNTYPEQKPAFFPAISGIQHIPIGASISTFSADPALSDIAGLFNGTRAQCVNSGQCSIQTQRDAVRAYTGPATGGGAARDWAVVMLHPQDFSSQSSIAPYLMAVFAAAQQGNFQIVKVGDLSGIVTGTAEAQDMGA